MSFLDTLQRYLPTGIYRFVGGPADGIQLGVQMRTDHLGTWPPQIWTYDEPLSAIDIPLPGPMPFDATIVRHRYRFVCTGRIANVGHYEWIER